MEIKSVQRYIQKRNLIKSLNEYLDDYEKVFVLIDPFIYKKYQKIFDAYSYGFGFEISKFK